MARAAQAAEGADRRVWPELSVRPARPGASRMLVIAQLTFPETRKCDISVTLLKTILVRRITII